MEEVRFYGMNYASDVADLELLVVCQGGLGKETGRTSRVIWRSG